MSHAFNHVRSEQDIIKMSDAELEEYLNIVPAGHLLRPVAYEELSRRRLRSIAAGHWTTTPAFWVTVGALIFAMIAAWPQIREWFR
jgi:hypothetical protein